MLRNISAQKSVTRMTAANLAVCVAPALLWPARRGSRPPKLGDEHMMRDAGRLSLVVRRVIDAAEDPALFGDDLDYPTPFAGVVITTPSEPSSFCVSDAPMGNER